MCASAEPPPPATLLEVRDLRVQFDLGGSFFRRASSRLHAVDGVSFSIGTGETLGLVGESGCGKTSVGRAILRLVKPTAGVVRFDGRDVLGARGPRLRALRRDMQIVFQDPLASLNPRMRIGDIIAEPLVVHRIAQGRDALRRHAIDLLHRCGMPEDAIDRYPREFSGGQRQRIAIARALASRPRLLVCDEPTSALDVSIRAQIINLLMDLQKDFGLSMLFISHDMSVVQHACTRVAVMQAGRIVEVGERDRVLRAPEHEYTRRLLRAVPMPDPHRASA